MSNPGIGPITAQAIAAAVPDAAMFTFGCQLAIQFDLTAATAIFSLAMPDATASQNCRCSSHPAVGGMMLSQIDVSAVFDCSSQSPSSRINLWYTDFLAALPYSYRLHGAKPSVEPLGATMAHVKLREDPGTNIRALYLVDATVGRSSANRRDDVLLVQFFLNALWGKSPDKKTVIGGSGAAPAVDGVCGHITVGAIETFQRWYWQQPARGGFVDARVEPLPVGQLFGPLHNLPYAIIGLNVNFGFAFGVDRHARLSKEPNFPMELKPKLFV